VSRVVQYRAEGWFAAKGWGKTYNMLGRARYYATLPSCRGVLYIDPPQNVRAEPGLELFSSYEQYKRRCDDRGSVPRLAVFQLGLEPAPYRDVFRAAIAIGDTFLVVDEAQRFAASGRKPEAVELIQIAEMGRHMRDAAGEERQVSLCVSSQRYVGLSNQVRAQLTHLYCGGQRGRGDVSALEDEAAADTKERLATLKLHQWAVLVAPPGDAKLPPIR
jgi:hypothetical protein